MWTLYRAKHRVLDKAENQNCNSYNKLHSYGHIVKERNPGSMAYLQTITPVPGGPTLFQRFFLNFTAQKDGFLYGCRPFIRLDACHLKGKFSRVLMSAVGLDANNGVFPIALCVAEGESKQSWGWFLEQLYLHIGLEETRRVTFMSDRQKGVLDTVVRQWPRATNRFCVRHIIANLQAKYRGPLNGVYVWDATNKSNKREFLEEIEKLKLVNIDAYNYVMGIPLKSWCIHEFDTHVKSEHTTNNISENFNSWVDELRSLPALHMLESIRRKLMKRANKRLESTKKWDGNVPPAVCKKLAKMQDKGRFVTVLCASETKFEVKDELIYYNVDLENYTCDCGFWQVSGIPCKHAMAVINTKRLNSHDFVHKYLTKEYYLKTYSHVINPIPNEFLWPEIEHIEVLPPMKKKMSGRPKKKQKNEQR
ncbi:hypothetical protein Ddye_021716 [Dipteronia dyeriana]|uniref:SWIM-type domain-containing protein n=1 Tax=Dipteronia dyeriana TaxID=168575 RepID=A0AAD9U2Z4_9ROSI|nr:hypothetical protein Ddye_021716 [Dipteronia dyeriana]